MKIKHIILFINPYNQYDVIHSFRKSFCKSLEKKGIRITFQDYTWDGIRGLISQDPPDCTFAFNGIRKIEGKRFLADILEIPHVAWLVDASYYFSELPESNYNIIFCPDQKSADQMRKWGSNHAFFLPHAFDQDELFNPEEERPYPFTFLASLFDYLEIEEKWKRELPEKLKNGLMAAADEFLSSYDLSVIDIFEKVFQEYTSTFSPKSKLELLKSFDQYIRGKDRISLLKALQGIPLHIFGESLSKSGRTWLDFLDVEEGAYIFHPEVNFPQAIEIMKKSKVIISNTPTVKHGAHERLFYGLGLGALVFTNDTPWTKSHFSEEEGIISYTPTNISKKISEVQTLPQRIERIKKGQAKILKEHTWDIRAETFISIIEKELDTYGN